METIALVTPFCFAIAATSSSAMKQCAVPPSFCNARLLIPESAMLVSVTMSAPCCKASNAVETAVLEKTAVV